MKFYGNIFRAVALASVLFFLAGCPRSLPVNPSNAATGSDIAVTGALLEQLPPHTDESGKPILKAAAASNDKAAGHNQVQAAEFAKAIDALSDEVDDHQKDNEKNAAQIKELKSMVGYKIEMFILGVLHIAKWVLILFGAWPLLAVGVKLFAPAVGELMLAPWLWIVKAAATRILGLIKGHRTGVV